MMRRIAAQTHVEVLLTLRRGESLLVVAGIPIGILAFFATVDVLPHGRGRAIDFLVPGVLALSVISSAMTSLGIATGFERHAGVLRRLGTTPLGRGGLLAAKLMSLIGLVALQVVAVCTVSFVLGWHTGGSVPLALVVLFLGVIAFAGIGFTLAGRLRAETNLAAANGLFLVFLLLGGIVVPVARLPASLSAVARVLPAEPLATGLRAALQHGTLNSRPIVSLTIWAIGAVVLAVASFKWE